MGSSQLTLSRVTEGRCVSLMCKLHMKLTDTDKPTEIILVSHTDSLSVGLTDSDATMTTVTKKS